MARRLDPGWATGPLSTKPNVVVDYKSVLILHLDCEGVYLYGSLVLKELEIEYDERKKI